MTRASLEYSPIAFADLPGWPEDDHAAAFACFRSSAPYVIARARAAGETASATVAVRQQPSPGLLRACRLCLELDDRQVDARTARAFFERQFRAYAISAAPPEPGLLTGYFEPELPASRHIAPEFSVPVLSRPADLVNLVDEAERGAKAGTLTHARAAPEGFVPYATRAEIEKGALGGQGLEIAYLADAVDLYVMQVQGSGILRFTDGTAVRLVYDGKNGHPYTSIGRHLIETGEFKPEEMTFDALVAWLKADPARARATMWHNKSYVFFRELGPAERTATLGVDHVPLTPGRSLAVDTGFHEIGAPLFVTAPALQVEDGGSPTGLARLMIAQDVGSAIRGPERGDFFYGAGADAGRRAGATKHACRFFVLCADPPGEAAGKARDDRSDEAGGVA